MIEDTYYIQILILISNLHVYMDEFFFFMRNIKICLNKDIVMDKFKMSSKI